MDWLKDWNEAMDYLESHLDGEIDPEELGRLAGCSPYHIVGVRIPLPTETEEGFEQVPKFWAEQAGRIPEICALMEPEFPGLLGASTCHREQENYYYIAAATHAPVPEGMWEEEVPGCTWAIFSGSGAMPDAMQELQKRIVSEWLPDSGYEWAQAPDVEVYLSRPGEPENRFQVWLPVVKKD